MAIAVRERRSIAERFMSPRDAIALSLGGRIGDRTARSPVAAARVSTSCSREPTGASNWSLFYTSDPQMGQRPMTIGFSFPGAQRLSATTAALAVATTLHVRLGARKPARGPDSFRAFQDSPR